MGRLHVRQSKGTLVTYIAPIFLVVESLTYDLSDQVRDTFLCNFRTKHVYDVSDLLVARKHFTNSAKVITVGVVGIVMPCAKRPIYCWISKDRVI